MVNAGFSAAVAAISVLSGVQRLGALASIAAAQVSHDKVC